MTWLPPLLFSRFHCHCCVFRSANGCSTHHSLVEINAKTTFLSLTEENKEKESKVTQTHAKTCNKRGVYQPLGYDCINIKNSFQSSRSSIVDGFIVAHKSTCLTKEK